MHFVPSVSTATRAPRRGWRRAAASLALLALLCAPSAQAELTQIGERPLTHPAREPRLRVRRAPDDEDAEDVQRDDDVQRGDVARDDAPVDRGGGEGRRRPRCRHAQGDRDEGEDRPRAGGAQQRREPAHLAAAVAGAPQAPPRVLPQQVQALTEAGVLGRDRRAVVDGRAPVAVRGHRPATSGSSGLRVRKTWSGRPFSTISR